MRQAILLGLLAGFLALVVLVLVLTNHGGDASVTAFTGAVTTIVGVLVTALSFAKQANPPGDGGQV